MNQSLSLATHSLNRKLNHSSKNVNLIITVQEDLARLSDIVYQLSVMSEKQLRKLDLSDQLINVHQCLKQFENYCQSKMVLDYDDPFIAEPEEWNEQSCLDDQEPIMNYPETIQECWTRQLFEMLTHLSLNKGEIQNNKRIIGEIAKINQWINSSINDSSVSHSLIVRNTRR